MVSLDKTLNNILFWNLKMHLLIFKKLNHRMTRIFTVWKAHFKNKFWCKNSCSSLLQKIAFLKKLTKVPEKHSPVSFLSKDGGLNSLWILENSREQENFKVAMSKFFININRLKNFYLPIFFTFVWFITTVITIFSGKPRWIVETCHQMT